MRASFHIKLIGFVTGDHYKQIILPHFTTGKYFSRWLDFKLKIYNATGKDSGIFTFTAHSVKGSVSMDPVPQH